MFPAAPPTRTLDFTVEHGTSQVSQRKALDLPNNATAPGREELLSISKVPLRFDRVVGGLKGEGAGEPSSRAKISPSDRLPHRDHRSILLRCVQEELEPNSSESFMPPPLPPLPPSPTADTTTANNAPLLLPPPAFPRHYS